MEGEWTSARRNFNIGNNSSLCTKAIVAHMSVLSLRHKRPPNSCATFAPQNSFVPVNAEDAQDAYTDSFRPHILVAVSRGTMLR